jgi:hypothetical protein
MSKDTTPYFSHDDNARHDQKILAMRSVYGFEGYGLYWAIVEKMRSQENYMISCADKYWINSLAMDFAFEKDKLENFISDCIDEFKLFQRNTKYLYSESLLGRMKLKDKKKEQSRKAAKERWEKDECENDADALHPHSVRIDDAMQNDAKEIKLNEIENENKTNLDFSFEAFKQQYPTAKDGNKPGMTRAQKIYSQSVNGKRTEIFKALENYANSEQAENGIVMSAEKFLLTDWNDWLNLKPNGQNGSADNDDDEIIL